jgi:hypothetical protein
MTLGDMREIGMHSLAVYCDRYHHDAALPHPLQTWCILQRTVHLLGLRGAPSQKRPSTRSSAETQQIIKNSRPSRARIRETISVGKRSLFSRLPPHASVRFLVRTNAMFNFASGQKC